MISREKDIKIKGIVATIPDNMVVNLDYISTFGEKEVKKQIKVTGVETRCVAKDGQRGADLCIASAEKLIDELENDLIEMFEKPINKMEFSESAFNPQLIFETLTDLVRENLEFYQHFML